jgi:hypothetical protein
LGFSVLKVLGGICSIPLNLESFGGPNLGYGVPNLVEQFGRSGVGFGGLDPRMLLSSCHTGLTGASHRSDRCRLLLSFARVNIWVSSLLSCVAAVSSLG